MRRLSRALLAALPLLAATASGPAHAQSPATAARALPPVTKLLVFVEENHSLDGMTAGMPYTASLAERYGYATDYHAIRHPSLPNYIAIAAGSTYGVADDKVPAYHRLSGRSVFGQALRNHRSAATYAESMPVPCGRTNAGAYAPKHNPWTYFAGERTGCRAHDRSMSAFGSDVAAGRLPRVGMVVPNLRHDAHDGSLATADTWFKAQMTKVFAGPDWRSGRLAVVLTADEDDHTQGNTVLTVVIHPSQDHRVVTTRLTHYSLTRLYDEVAGLPYLRNAATAPSMATAFGLPVG
jgi:phosphatidylinositol-3-phosphatase